MMAPVSTAFLADQPLGSVAPQPAAAAAAVAPDAPAYRARGMAGCEPGAAEGSAVASLMLGEATGGGEAQAAQDVAPAGASAAATQPSVISAAGSVSLLGSEQHGQEQVQAVQKVVALTPAGPSRLSQHISQQQTPGANTALEAGRVMGAGLMEAAHQPVPVDSAQQQQHQVERPCCASSPAASQLACLAAGQQHTPAAPGTTAAGRRSAAACEAHGAQAQPWAASAPGRLLPGHAAAAQTSGALVVPAATQPGVQGYGTAGAGAAHELPPCGSCIGKARPQPSVQGHLPSPGLPHVGQQAQEAGAAEQVMLQAIAEAEVASVAGQDGPQLSLGGLELVTKASSRGSDEAHGEGRVPSNATAMQPCTAELGAKRGNGGTSPSASAVPSGCDSQGPIDEASQLGRLGGALAGRAGSQAATGTHASFALHGSSPSVANAWEPEAATGQAGYVGHGHGQPADVSVGGAAAVGRVAEDQLEDCAIVNARPGAGLPRPAATPSCLTHGKPRAGPRRARTAHPRDVQASPSTAHQGAVTMGAARGSSPSRTQGAGRAGAADVRQQPRRLSGFGERQTGLGAQGGGYTLLPDQQGGQAAQTPGAVAAVPYNADCVAAEYACLLTAVRRSERRPALSMAATAIKAKAPPLSAGVGEGWAPGTSGKGRTLLALMRTATKAAPLLPRAAAKQSRLRAREAAGDAGGDVPAYSTMGEGQDQADIEGGMHTREIQLPVQGAAQGGDEAWHLEGYGSQPSAAAAIEPGTGHLLASGRALVAAEQPADSAAGNGWQASAGPVAGRSPGHPSVSGAQCPADSAACMSMALPHDRPAQGAAGTAQEPSGTVAGQQSVGLDGNVSGVSPALSLPDGCATARGPPTEAGAGAPATAPRPRSATAKVTRMSGVSVGQTPNAVANSVVKQAATAAGPRQAGGRKGTQAREGSPVLEMRTEGRAVRRRGVVRKVVQASEQACAAAGKGDAFEAERVDAMMPQEGAGAHRVASTGEAVPATRAQVAGDVASLPPAVSHAAGAAVMPPSSPASARDFCNIAASQPDELDLRGKELAAEPDPVPPAGHGSAEGAMQEDQAHLSAGKHQGGGAQQQQDEQAGGGQAGDTTGRRKRIRKPRSKRQAPQASEAAWQVEQVQHCEPQPDQSIRALRSGKRRQQEPVLPPSPPLPSPQPLQQVLAELQAAQQEQQARGKRARRQPAASVVATAPAPALAAAVAASAAGDSPAGGARAQPQTSRAGRQRGKRTATIDGDAAPISAATSMHGAHELIGSPVQAAAAGPAAGMGSTAAVVCPAVPAQPLSEDMHATGAGTGAQAHDGRVPAEPQQSAAPRPRRTCRTDADTAAAQAPAVEAIGASVSQISKRRGRPAAADVGQGSVQAAAGLQAAHATEAKEQLDGTASVQQKWRGRRQAHVEAAAATQEVRDVAAEQTVRKGTRAKGGVRVQEPDDAQVAEATAEAITRTGNPGSPSEPEPAQARGRSRARRKIEAASTTSEAAVADEHVEVMHSTRAKGKAPQQAALEAGDVRPELAESKGRSVKKAKNGDRPTALAANVSQVVTQVVSASEGRATRRRGAAGKVEQQQLAGVANATAHESGRAHQPQQAQVTATTARSRRPAAASAAALAAATPEAPVEGEEQARVLGRRGRREGAAQAAAVQELRDVGQRRATRKRTSAAVQEEAEVKPVEVEEARGTRSTKRSKAAA